MSPPRRLPRESVGRSAQSGSQVRQLSDAGTAWVTPSPREYVTPLGDPGGLRAGPALTGEPEQRRPMVVGSGGPGSL
ncbi:hypothetical protein NDU88_009311 [Pleurodeles waltl]|uniref:Uncharacterized protein n=1 Tax=Pleurodeles waltl TaxID=8319 RepID=A0AAV7PUN8_PLEWA|nr:hypothetical protein NDU88_009311 [Pleurodeles waltl]